MDIWIEEYSSGDSIPIIAERYAAPRSRVRTFLIRNGVQMRTRAEGMIASIPYRKPPPPHRSFTEEHKRAIKEARKKWGDENAKCVSRKPSGYLEYTTGELKGKSIHVQLMEDRIGRKLLPDEVVHHIDRDRSNNDLNNLALMTRSAHGRLHRFEDSLEGRKRNKTCLQ